jgi:hypothetical protein
MRQCPKAHSRSVQLIDSLQNRGSLVRYFVTAVVSTVLTFGPGNLGHSSRQRALGHPPRTAPTAARKLFVAAIEGARLARATKSPSAPGRWWFVFAL